MKRFANQGLAIKVALFTLLLTWAVIFSWEKWLQVPFYSWIQTHIPDGRRWVIEQRTEHFFISFTVDLIVVGMLLCVAARQKRALRANEERCRILVEQTQQDQVGHGPERLLHAETSPKVTAMTNGR